MDYAVNRFYNAAQGRFTQVDPIGMSAASLSDPQSLNLYSYCGNDPINHTDPDGLFFGKLFGWIGKALKWAFRVAAVIVAVIAVMAAAAVGQYWGSLLITKGLVALLFGSAGLLATAGWAPGKIGQIAGALVTAGLSWGGNFRTPNTFPNGTGAGGVSNFLGQQQGLHQQGKRPILPPISIRPIAEIFKWLIGDVDPNKVKPIPGSTGEKPPYGPCDSFMKINANYMYRYGGDDEWGQYVRAHLLENYKLGASPNGAHRQAWVVASIRVGPIDTAKGLGAAIYNGAGSYLYQSGRYAGERALRQISSMYPGGLQEPVVTQAFPCRNDVK